FKKFNVPLSGLGAFVLLFTKEGELSRIDMDFIYTVTSSIATALETRRLFEQLALKNSFLEKLFIGSAKLSEVNSFEELYQALYSIVNEMFEGCDFVIFRASKGEVFKPVYIRIANTKLYSFVEAAELSLVIINEELLKNFSFYKSLLVFKDEDQRTDLSKFFDLIFQRPYMVIPIIEKNKLSSLVVFNIKYQFWAGHQDILEVLANHLSILFSYVFSRISAYEKLLEKSNESKVINKVIFEYSSVRDINILIANMVKEINNLVSYSLPVFTFYKNKKIVVIKTIDYYKSLVLTIVNNFPELIIDKIRETVNLINKGNFKPVLINNLELFFDNVNIYDFIKKANLKSLLILPIKSELLDQSPVLLVFSIGKRFEIENIDLLCSLASHFSVFFENASIYSVLEERLKATDIMYNFLRIVTSVLDPYNVVMNSVDFLEELFKPEILCFILKKYNRFELIYTKPSETKIDYNLVIKSLNFLGTNVSFLNSKNILADKNYKKIWNEFSKIPNINLKQIVVIPIVYLREILGYIIMGINKENLSESLIWMLTSIPYALSTPLKNSMIMQEQVEISNIIRQSLVTKIDRKSLVKKGIEVVFKHVTSREITADWVEFIDKKDSLIVIVADVSGKGAKSAIYTAQAKFAAKSLFQAINDFKYSLNQLNKILSSTVSDSTFITMFVIKIYSYEDKIYCQYVSAGHEPMIIIKKTKEIISLSTKDIPLCIEEDYEYNFATYELDKGDIIFLYTDGVIDIKNENNEGFGRERLIDLIKNISANTDDIKELTEKVYISIMKYSSTPLSNPPDDMTMLFLKIL
ncbi:MAG: PP2C family protein-serine/threonine phosphatase, partial [bacterium]